MLRIVNEIAELGGLTYMEVVPAEALLEHQS